MVSYLLVYRQILQLHYRLQFARYLLLQVLCCLVSSSPEVGPIEELLSEQPSVAGVEEEAAVKGLREPLALPVLLHLRLISSQLWLQKELFA